MRRVLSALAVGLLCIQLAGCGLFSPQDVTLSDTEKAELVDRLGDLTIQNRQLWEAEVGKLFDATALRVEAEGKKIVATLASPASDAIDRTGPAVVETIAKNPTPYGLAASAIALGTGLWAYLAKRSALKSRKVGGAA